MNRPNTHRHTVRKEKWPLNPFPQLVVYLDTDDFKRIEQLKPGHIIFEYPYTQNTTCLIVNVQSTIYSPITSAYKRVVL